MSCIAVLGTQWGDEGKAKMIDYYSAASDIIVRYQGGANAGHTVVINDKKYIFHLIPSGILHKDKTCVISNGVVLDPEQLLTEIDMLARDGITVSGRLFISDAAHLILPYHKALDAAMEESSSNKIGTTRRGIGPSYADKALRIGIRVGDILDDAYLVERVNQALRIKNVHLEKIYGLEPFKAADVMDLLRSFRERIGDMIVNTQNFLYQALRENRKILLEGAQGNALDIDHGTFPFVTSSNTTIGGALTGTGLPPFAIKEVIGITKAYVTRVGEGPFPTEDKGEMGILLREKGGEFGSTTGRPRRCGWFDCELLNFAKRTNGLTSIALTKLDVLSGMKKIRISVGYEMNGRRLEYCPTSSLDRILPVYEELDGWDEDISKCLSYEELPSRAKEYIRFITNALDLPISIVSVGPDRKNTFAML
ncbi:MAG: adenylosuccinate synthase [Spirochaetes bacterium]|nr:MAG: adenylosuccinate synthase [Spirochaetota bacterium]